MLNALSIDVEEYFQVASFRRAFPPNTWDGLGARVRIATEKVLSILARHSTKATFFIVGWVARRHPGTVKATHSEGREIACHSYAHQEISEHTPDTFRKDLRLAKSILEDITGQRIRGYRAPTFSITWATLWALDILVEKGFEYDSSIFPVRHDRYGIPKAERFPNVVLRSGHSILEFPISTVRLMGINLPFSGGGYMRLLRLSFASWAIDGTNRQGQPAIVYVHPWEFDPDQPPIAVPAFTRFRHYHNMSAMAAKLDRLLDRHSFAPVSQVLENYLK